METFTTIAAAVPAFLLGALLGYLACRGRAMRAEAVVQVLEERSPVADLDARLERLDRKLEELARDRVGSFEALSERLKMLGEGTARLEMQAARLAKAMASPSTRGRWGELQLRRVVELAGMTAHCDFDEQVRSRDDSGMLRRPDMVVHLPGGASVVIDSKVPLDAYLAAVECEDENERRRKMEEHAACLRRQVQDLGRKAYWLQFDEAPEFVVLFLPGESFFSAALQYEPGLIEYAADRKVVIATPTTLIALLKAVALGWRSEAVERHAAEVARLGAELYKRVSDLAGHFNRMGRSLDKAVLSYNKMLGTLESRVLASARKLAELEAVGTGTGDDAERVRPVETLSRPLSAAELLGPGTACDENGEEGP